VSTNGTAAEPPEQISDGPAERPSDRQLDRPGIVDVARRAGVSVATVSRALRGLPNVSRDTRTRVLSAADDLGYSASPLASGLATGRMRAVGVVLQYAGGWFFAEVVRGIEQALRRHDYDLVLHVLSDDQRRREFFASLPVRRRVDAILVVGLELDDAEAEVLRSLGLPLAWVGEPVEGAHGELVDDAAAARVAVEHLLALGHRRIACVGGDTSTSGPARLRTQGYRQALAAAGLEPEQGWELDGGFTPEGARAVVVALMEAAGERPTAFFCHSDEMAFGALGALRELGFDCPRDVSVVGLDGHELAATFGLTTVAQPVLELGGQAARWLVAHLADADSPEEDDDEDEDLNGATGPHLHEVRLLVRGSTAAPARSSGQSSSGQSSSG
jgi:LacI family repressor for deo operon, udp, cdd, tsx, nupC, and nupG